MSNETQQSTDPIILGEVAPEELQQIIGLKRQADQILHQIGVNRVQEQRMIAHLHLTEENTNAILTGVGKRLGIPNGVPWSVTSEGKAVQSGPVQVPPKMQIVKPDEGEDQTPGA